jgi:hypothetical protein
MVKMKEQRRSIASCGDPGFCTPLLHKVYGDRDLPSTAVVANWNWGLNNAAKAVFP